MAKTTPRQGFTLLEVIVSLGVTVLLFAVTFILLKTSVVSWNRVSGDQNVSGQLLKAESWLRRDLFGSSYSALDTAPGPSTLAGRDGDALWFLSAVDPDTDEFIRNDDGTPRWQRNILYYPVIASGLDLEHSGGGIDAGGYEVSYPYKLLVRKVIDSGGATDPLLPATQEALITDITPFLEQPTGYDFPSGDSESVTIVARSLLSFQVTTNDTLRRVDITLQAANTQEAGKLFAIGTRSLVNPQFLMLRQFVVYPSSRQALTP
jgi:prepilin-type N-terminal cleavage/methylation domain-containing protein